jgi:hypothetical protein
MVSFMLFWVSASLPWAGLSLKSPNGCEGTGSTDLLRDDEVVL